MASTAWVGQTETYRREKDKMMRYGNQDELISFLNLDYGRPSKFTTLNDNDF
jgi:hypothetical protein